VGAIHKRVLSCILTGCLAIAVPPIHAAVIIQLRVLEGEGAVYAIGSRATRGLTVQVTDESGKPVEGATVSFTLPIAGSGGTFKSGLRTEVLATQADGKAAIWGMQWNRLPGPFEIKITASKDQARAGIVSTQYLNNFGPPKAGDFATPKAGDFATPKAGDFTPHKAGGEGTFRASHSHTKWIVIAALAAGAAAGLALGRTAHTPAAVATSPVGLQIGSPSIILGHP
jgi:hypothetical protein